MAARCSPRYWIHRYSRVLLIRMLILLCAILVTPVLAAAAPVMQETSATTGFSTAQAGQFEVKVQDGAGIDAAAFLQGNAQPLTGISVELGSLFPGLADPIEITVFTDDAALAAAAPEAERDDLIGYDPESSGLVLSMKRFGTSSPVEIAGGWRHALARLGVERQSAGAMPLVFAEGFASYAERMPPARASRAAALVQNARTAGDPLAWNELADMDASLAAADQANFDARAFGLTAFLVERYGLRSFADFSQALATAPDWQTAIRAVYQRAPAELEAEWLADLSRWTTTGWRDNQFAAFDLAPVQEDLQAGRFAAAKRGLEQSLRLYNDLGVIDRQAAAEPLLRQAETGLQAENLMTQIETALKERNYDRARELVTQARAAYALLPDEQRSPTLLDRFESMTATGQTAIGNLTTASALAASWRDYPEARRAALAASSGFATLGDEPRYTETTRLLSTLDDRQLRLIALLGVLALLALVWVGFWTRSRGAARLDWGP